MSDKEESRIHSTDLLHLSAIQGIAKTTQFTVLPDNSYAILYDKSIQSFFRIDLGDGKKVKLTTSQFKAIVGSTEWFGLHSINDTANRTYVVVALVQEQESGKFYAVSFMLKHNEDKVEVLKEVSLDVAHRHKDSPLYGGLQMSETGKLYALVYWFLPDRKDSGFHLVRIDLTPSGDITIKIDAKDVVLSGYGHHSPNSGNRRLPIINKNEVWWLSTQPDVLVQPLDNRSTRSVVIGNRKQVVWSNPCMFEGHAFFYTCDQTIATIRELSLSLSEETFETRLQVMTDHVIGEHASMVITENGSLYIHGNCAIKGCEEKTHLYQLDIKAPSKWIHEKTLNKGGFGVVCTGYAGTLDRFIAAKFVKNGVRFTTLSKERQQQELWMFIREARRLKTFNHECVVTGHGFYIERNQAMLFMEAMDRSVRDKLDTDGPYKEGDALPVFADVLKGLHYLHDMKPEPVIHRDVKASNVLLKTDGTKLLVKIGDIGLGFSLPLKNDETDINYAPTHTVGTAWWTAPEVLNGNKYGRRSDIWSAGCLLFEMLTTKPPREISTLKGQFIRTAREKDNVLKDISEDIFMLFQMMLTERTKEDEGDATSPVRASASALLAEIGEQKQKAIRESLKKEEDDTQQWKKIAMAKNDDDQESHSKRSSFAGQEDEEVNQGDAFFRAHKTKLTDKEANGLDNKKQLTSTAEKDLAGKNAGFWRKSIRKLKGKKK